MRKTKFAIAIIAIAGLAGCLESDLERGIAGAGAGIVIADIFGGDSTTSAVVGAAAGVFCDDAGYCR